MIIVEMAKKKFWKWVNTSIIVFVLRSSTEKEEKTDTLDIVLFFLPFFFQILAFFYF